MNSKESRVNFKSIMIKKPKYFKLKSQANNAIWSNLFTFNIKQASIFFDCSYNSIQQQTKHLTSISQTSKHIFIQKAPKEKERMIQIDFLCTDANIFFYLTTIHTPPFLLRRALKLSFFFSYFNFNPPVIKIMFCHRIFFGVFIDSRNASIITFSRIF